ncbi:TPA: hypothetical protein RTG18_001629 [Campylobacter jejuni]|nr:hypothetical protein [Campylobacter jejuni]HDZ4977679.1 hypothetical protein [Campylobacter jejuni]HDZ4994647.1 hypothetical protein [Campylobacter jejuni]HDZ4999729.1 hypothetical protein [Campylobacter jejuni]HDZ5004635.1 hypothetical protein [Campylobacter jejuni]
MEALSTGVAKMKGINDNLIFKDIFMKNYKFGLKNAHLEKFGLVISSVEIKIMLSILRCCVICKGQSEEKFIKETLGSYFYNTNVYECTEKIQKNLMKQLDKNAIQINF